MKSIIIGFGEVGRAHFNVLKDTHQVCYKDKDSKVYDWDDREYDFSNGAMFDIMMIATHCDPADMEPFYKMVQDYANEYCPKHIDILTTTPVGASEEIHRRTKIPTTRSSIRGMHPNLDKFLLDIPKHIGGPNKELMKDYYTKAGIICVLHEKARVVEFAHKWNNAIYGVNIMAINECAEDARRESVDFHEFIKYRETQNSGFIRAGYPSKVSPILYPSGGGIGGHCVVYAATTIPKENRGPLMSLLAGYNEKTLREGHDILKARGT